MQALWVWDAQFSRFSSSSSPSLSVSSPRPRSWRWCMCGWETDELQEAQVVDGPATSAIKAIKHLGEREKEKTQILRFAKTMRHGTSKCHWYYRNHFERICAICCLLWLPILTLLLHILRPPTTTTHHYHTQNYIHETATVIHFDTRKRIITTTAPTACISLEVRSTPNIFMAFANSSRSMVPLLSLSISAKMALIRPADCEPDINDACMYVYVWKFGMKFHHFMYVRQPDPA